MKKLIYFILLVSTSSYAQTYVAEAPLSKVEKDGFYEIPLPSKVTSLLFPDSRNIRILDTQDSEVPYVTMSERPQYNNLEWKTFRMEKELKKGCCTIVTLFNDDKKSIRSFLLEIKNAAVFKSGVLRGSEDGKTWYALRENFQVSMGEFNGKTVMEILDFPLSEYPYYQLTINDSTSSPLNVVAAWTTTENVTQGVYIDVPGISFVQSDSAKGRYSWISIHSDTSQFIHKMEFDIDGPRFYKRRVTVFENGHYFVNKKKVWDLKEMYSFEVGSGQLPVIHTYAKENDIYLRVDNENNPPLKFKSIRAYQLKQSLVAYLETGRSYRIAIGTDSLEAPVYDLDFFRDSIPANPTQIEIGRLKSLSKIKQAEEPSPTYFRDERIIWAAIALVIIVLALMVRRMLSDKNMTDNQSH